MVTYSDQRFPHSHSALNTLFQWCLDTYLADNVAQGCQAFACEPTLGEPHVRDKQVGLQSLRQALAPNVLRPFAQCSNASMIILPVSPHLESHRWVASRLDSNPLNKLWHPMSYAHLQNAWVYTCVGEVPKYETISLGSLSFKHLC